MKRICLYMALFLPFAAFSQGKNDTIVLKEIEISEPYPSLPGIARISANESVVTENRLKDVSGILASMPSLHVRSAGPGSSSLAYVRGAGASHTSLTWNGMLLNSPMTGQADISLVPALFTDDILLLAGNNSSFGTVASIGGTLCLDNQPVWDKPRHFTLMLNGGSFGNYSGGMVLSSGNRNVISRIRIYGKQEANRYPYLNNAVIPAEKMLRENAGIGQGSFQHELFLRKRKNNYSLITWAGISNRSIPVLMTSVTAADHDEKQKDRFLRITASGEWNRRRVSFFFKPFMAASDLSYHLIHHTQGGSITSLDTYSEEQSAGSHQGMRFHLGKNIIRSGVTATVNHVQVSDKKFGSGYSHLRKEINPYLNTDCPLGKRFRLLASIRSGINDREVIPLQPSLHLYYRPENQKLPVVYVSAGKNLRFPSLNDLFFIPGGNPDLKNEKSRSYEAGMEDCLFRIAGTCVEVTVTLFYQEIEDWIIWQPSQYGYWKPFNIRNATSQGFSCNVSWTREFKNGKAGFSSQYTFNSAHAQDEQYETGQPVYLPLHNLYAAASGSLRQWNFAASGFFMSERKTSLYKNTWSPYLEPVWIQNISAARKFNTKKAMFEAGIRCENLFDIQWQQVLWRPMTGRSFQLTLSFELK